MNIYAVIMAGGSGERFWPQSRVKQPKQFLNIVGRRTMIQQTIDRIKPVIPLRNVFIVANQNHKDLIFRQLPKISKKRVILEPLGKNTAPCIALAAAYLNKLSSNSIMVVLPSDHIVKNEKIFNQLVLEASKIAEETDSLITIGIKPNQPETGYGYIKIGEKKKQTRYAKFYKVDKFVEKPSFEKAKKYVQSQKYVWNSGMFIWKTETILKAIKKHCPDLYRETSIVGQKLFTRYYKNAVGKMYKKIEKISIDYAVMEKAKNIQVVTGSFDWDDVGAWPSLERHCKKNPEQNITFGESIGVESKDNLIISQNGLIATLGINNHIIIQTKDATLIADKSRAQDVKLIVEKIKKDKKLNKYL